jgi:hypothetical protein
MADQNIKVKIDLDVTEFNKSVKAMSDALSKVLGKDVEIFNGKINKTKKLVEDTDKALNNATSSINKAGNSLKQSNQQWTNLALVVQDLPFGFRGIQNNLPALLGGFAAVTGPIYLGISAVIAALTIWDEKTRQAASAAKKLKEEQASLNDEILQSTQSGRQQGILLKAYIDIANNATLTDNVRNEALKKANELYGEHNQKLTLANINTEKVKKSVDGYIQSLIHMAVAQKYSDQVANNIVKTDKIQAQIDKKKEQSYALLLEYTGKQTLASRDVVDVMYDRRVVEGEIAKLEAQKAANAQELITLTDKYSKSLLEATKLSAEFGKIEQTKTTKAEKPSTNNYLEELAQEQFNYYKDSIFQAEFYFKNLNDLQKNAALMDAIIKKASVDELFIIQQTYEQKEINFRKSIEDKKFAIRQQSEEMQKQLTKSYEDKKLKDQYDYTTNYIKTLDLQLKAELRLHRNNVAFQQEDTKNKIKQLEIAKLFAHGNVKALDAINAAILRLQGALTGLGDLSTSIDEILRNTLQSTFEGIGESLGELVTTGKFNLGTLGTILADALISIGKALILYSSLVQAAKKAIESGNVKGGLILGIAAVAAGFALKGQINKKRSTTGAKEFADGGIISGPTLGLMGEYPGASRNPEVVAPLDKLKSLIGDSGGGTLEARISGNDLLILMNKAGRTNNNTF